MCLPVSISWCLGYNTPLHPDNSLIICCLWIQITTDFEWMIWVESGVMKNIYIRVTVKKQKLAVEVFLVMHDDVKSSSGQCPSRMCKGRNYSYMEHCRLKQVQPFGWTKGWNCTKKLMVARSTNLAPPPFAWHP